MTAYSSDSEARSTVGAASMAVAAGVVLALALPGAGIAPLLLLFPGLLLEAVRLAPTVRRAAVVGWLGGVVHWAISTHWVVPVMHDYGGLPLVTAVGCLLGMAGILATTWALVTALTRRVSPVWRPLALASLWAATEVLREGPLYRFPWNPIAAGLTGTPALLASLPVWGAVGLGWAVVAVGGGLWMVFRGPQRAAGLRTVGLAAGLVVVFGALAPAPRCTGDPIRVGILQPGTTLEENWDSTMAAQLFRRVERLTHSAAAAGARLVLWPESAVPGSLEHNPGLTAWVERLARDDDVTIVLNSIGWNEDGRPTNSAYVVAPDGLRPERYDKVRLVPFGEYVPWWARWGFAEGLVREVGSFAPGQDPQPLVTPYGKVGIAVCYEIVFSSLVAREVRAGADLLVTLTNDGWYGHSWAPTQHFAQAVLRAVETRRWVLRAALTGISGAVDPRGEVRSHLGTGRDGLLLVEARRCSGSTPEASLGEWWVWVALLVAALALARSQI